MYRYVQLCIIMCVHVCICECVCMSICQYVLCEYVRMCTCFHDVLHLASPYRKQSPDMKIA